MTLQPRQFQQLQLYMTPDELGNLQSADYPLNHVRDVPGIKAEEAHGDDRLASYDRMANKMGGIHRPVYVAHHPGGSELWDGHHRATVALQTGRLVPVTHAETSARANDVNRAATDGEYDAYLSHETHWENRMDEIVGRSRR